MNQLLPFYYQRFPFLFNFFDFLRDFFLSWQLLLILIFIFTSRKTKNAFYYFLIFILAFLLSGLIKSIFPSLRPHGLSWDSFPSRHTTISFALSLALIYQNLKYGIFSLVLTLLISIFSFLSLQHWLIDILFGFVLGFLVFLITYKILNFFNWFNVNTSQDKT